MRGEILSGVESRVTNIDFICHEQYGASRHYLCLTYHGSMCCFSSHDFKLISTSARFTGVFRKNPFQNSVNQKRIKSQLNSNLG